MKLYSDELIFLFEFVSECRHDIRSQVPSTLRLAIKQFLPQLTRRIKLFKRLLRLFPPEPFRILETSNGVGCMEDGDCTATGLFDCAD